MPPKTNTSSGSTSKKSKEEFSWQKFVIELASRFGVSGAVTLCILLIFLIWGTVDQKREFIDKFILLNNKHGDSHYPVYLVIIATVAFVGQRIYFLKRIKLKDDRIKELEHHNNSLENKLLKK
jgi:hypothetical protein